METIIIRIIRLMLDQMSPSLKTALRNSLLAWKENAAKTPSPWDDLVVDILLMLLTP